MAIPDTKAISILSTVFRPVKYAGASNPSSDTPIANLSNGAAEFVKDKGGITIALEDFEEKYDSLHGEDNSNINAKDAKGSFFGNIAAGLGLSRKNIYESEIAQEYLKETGNLFQSDIYYEESTKNGGILYAKPNDNVFEAALNFAKAEINVVERANISVGKFAGDNNKLDNIDINSYNYNELNNNELLEKLDLDGSKNLSVKEYASYMLAIDTAAQYYNPSAIAGFGAITPDGLISEADKQALENMDLDEIKERAAKYYEEL